MRNTKVNIVCISSGKHAIKNTIPVLIKSNYFNLVGIYTRNKNNNNLLKKKFKCKIFNSIKKLIKECKFDAAYVSSPPALHYNISKELLEINKHVLIEKPAVLSQREANKLIELTKNNKFALVEGFMYKFHKQFQELKMILRNEKIKQVEASFGFPHLPKNDFRYKKKLGGGSLLDAGCYTISAFRELLEEDLHLKEFKFKKENYEVDIRGKAIFKTKNDVKCIGNWFFGGKYKNQIKIVTENKTFVTERSFSKPYDLTTRIFTLKNKRLRTYKKIPKDNHFLNMFNYFYKTIYDIQKKEYEANNLFDQSKYISLLRKKIN